MLRQVAWLSGCLLGLTPIDALWAAEGLPPAPTMLPRPSTLAPVRSTNLRNFAGLWLLGEDPVAKRETLRPDAGAQFNLANSAGPAAGVGLAEVARQCVPGPLFGATGGYPLRVIQTATQLTLISEENNRVHRIYLDRDFPEKLAPSYGGFSIGHWEGNTLVAETHGLRFARGAPELPNYRVIERFSLTPDGLTFEQEVTVVSAAYATPAQRTYRYVSRPDLRWQPSVCEEFPPPLESAGR